VPARNMVFLSFAVSFAEASGADAVFIGAHQLDYSNYPDCRGGFFECFQKTVDAGTRSGVEGRGVKIIAPLLDLTKKEIVSEGLRLGVPFGNTWSCYRSGNSPCGVCESCLLRGKAFTEAGIADPLTEESLDNG
jgi:7-cyano-7-deazaguanine synthase